MLVREYKDNNVTLENDVCFVYPVMLQPGMRSERLQCCVTSGVASVTAQPKRRRVTTHVRYCSSAHRQGNTILYLQIFN